MSDKSEKTDAEKLESDVVSQLQMIAPRLATAITYERLRFLKEIAALRRAAKDLDDLLLRLAFDAGAIPDELVPQLGVDPWGSLADFRSAFGLAPTMSPEEWTQKQMRDLAVRTSSHERDKKRMTTTREQV